MSEFSTCHSHDKPYSTLKQSTLTKRVSTSNRINVNAGVNKWRDKNSHVLVSDFKTHSSANARSNAQASLNIPSKFDLFKTLAHYHKGVRASFIALGTTLLLGCNSLPNEPHSLSSIKLNERLDARYKLIEKEAQKQFNDENEERNEQLTEAISQQNAQHPNESGYYPIFTGANAYASRSILTDMASKSIDVQYYIWHNDRAGQLLLKRLWEAAERGVFVRLLLDDFNNNAKLDQHLLRFASHPNIAVRLVNPLVYRKLQTLNYLRDFRRINHRMHNKSMTFDRQISIIGGRNIGDEYLSYNETTQFADLDVLLIGPAVNDITDSFDEYWQSVMSYDIETLVEPNSDLLIRNKSDKDISFVAHLDKINASKSPEIAESLAVYNNAIKSSEIDTNLIEKELPFRWAKMTFLSDDVDKLSARISEKENLVYQLRQLLGTPTKRLSIVSSYFVPTKEGVDTLVKLANKGVTVKILTNSYNATDVAAVHAGYAQWRIPLLRAGITIYELKAIASEEDRENKLWRARSQSSTSLHAKTFAVDDHNVFIGSYNVDPRSANINTEMGVVIKDDSLASEFHDTISDDLLTQAYKVVLVNNNQLQWQTLENNKLVIYKDEPHVEFIDSLWINAMSLLPIDWLL